MEQQFPLMAVIGGQLGSISPTLILISAESELASISSEVPVGSIAYLAGFGTIWQKDPSGAWVEAE